MNLIYEPRWGALAAAQIGMGTRIIVISSLTFLFLRYVKTYSTRDLVYVGMMWLGLVLILEWGGSILIGRPVSEILIGWNVSAGYI